ncbi:hypothetical protein [Aminobacter sp. BA135]|uniref:hypothetical protein n=1 Tax=Aminobacter sp. BA135 TaxID=537596 RepID=UPI003D7B851B
MPETGVSPMIAIIQLMPALPALERETFADDDFGMVTVTHTTMGEAVFGIAWRTCAPPPRRWPQDRQPASPCCSLGLPEIFFARRWSICGWL